MGASRHHTKTQKPNAKIRPKASYYSGSISSEQQSSSGKDFRRQNTHSIAAELITTYSTSDPADKIHTSGSYPSDLRDNTHIYKTYTQFLTYNSGKAGCYTSLLTVKHGE